MNEGEKSARMDGVDRRFVLTAAAAAGAFAPKAQAQTSSPSARTLKYSDHEPLGGMRTRFLKDVLFAEIEKQSSGRIRIEDHWNGEIADSHGVLSALNTSGAAAIGIIVPEYFAQQLPHGQLFKSFLTGPSGQRQVEFFQRAFEDIPAFRKELARNGLTAIFYATGYPVAFYSTRPLSGLDGLAGQKWRTASFWHRDFLKAAGAVPVSIPWGQPVFDAIKSGDIDGLMVNVDSGYMLDVHKVAPNVLVSKQLWLGHVYIVAMNSDAWNRLPTEDQAAIRRAASHAYTRLGSTMDRSFEAMLEDLRTSGSTVRQLSPKEVEAFAHATNVPGVQSCWVAEQAAAGVEGITDTLARLNALMRTSNALT